MGNLQKKNPADNARQQEHGNAPTTLQQTYDPPKNAKLSSQGMAWAARDPPLGAGHEQPEAGTMEPETGQAQPRPGETFFAELLSPQKLGGTKFKIPTRTRASNQPGDHATSIMSGKEGASSAIIIRGRHSPPPWQDFTTQATHPTLQGRHDPAKPVSTAIASHTASLGPDTSTTPPLPRTWEEMLCSTGPQEDISK